MVSPGSRLVPPSLHVDALLVGNDGLTIRHVGGGHQGGEDDVGFAPVDDVVVVVAQRRPGPGLYRRGIRVGGADHPGALPLVLSDRVSARVLARLLQQPPG